jgi:hypothetical protein
VGILEAFDLSFLRKALLKTKKVPCIIGFSFHYVPFFLSSMGWAGVA